MPYPHPHALKPLAGLKIVSLAVNLPGPVAVARLRDLGARVTKVEPPDGDPLARGCPPWYQALHENVAVLPLDLKDPAAREQLFAQLGDADLLLTSSRPSALERLGLGWSELHSRFPRLCQVAIIGHVPPHEEQPGHDLTYQASLGLVDPPHMPRAPARRFGRSGRGRFDGRRVAFRPRTRRRSTGRLREPRRSGGPSRLAARVRAHRAEGLLGGGWPGYQCLRNGPRLDRGRRARAAFRETPRKRAGPRIAHA